MASNAIEDQQILFLCLTAFQVGLPRHRVVPRQLGELPIPTLGLETAKLLGKKPLVIHDALSPVDAVEPHSLALIGDRNVANFEVLDIDIHQFG